MDVNFEIHEQKRDIFIHARKVDPTSAKCGFFPPSVEIRKNAKNDPWAKYYQMTRPTRRDKEFRQLFPECSYVYAVGATIDRHDSPSDSNAIKDSMIASLPSDSNAIKDSMIASLPSDPNAVKDSTIASLPSNPNAAKDPNVPSSGKNPTPEQSRETAFSRCIICPFYMYGPEEPDVDLFREWLHYKGCKGPRIPKDQKVEKPVAPEASPPLLDYSFKECTWKEYRKDKSLKRIVVAMFQDYHIRDAIIVYYGASIAHSSKEPIDESIIPHLRQTAIERFAEKPRIVWGNVNDQIPMENQLRRAIHMYGVAGKYNESVLDRLDD